MQCVGSDLYLIVWATWETTVRGATIKPSPKCGEGTSETAGHGLQSHGFFLWFGRAIPEFTLLTHTLIYEGLSSPSVHLRCGYQGNRCAILKASIGNSAL